MRRFHSHKILRGLFAGLLFLASGCEAGLKLDDLTPSDSTSDGTSIEESNAIAVSSMARTSISSSDGGSVTLTFEFSVAPEASPQLTINGTAVDSCSLSGTTFTCTVSGVAGCEAFNDYTVALSGEGITDYTTSFSSGNSEFSSQEEIINCWNRAGEVDEMSVGGDVLSFSTTGADASSSGMTKTLPSPDDFAALVFLSSFSLPSIDSAVFQFGFTKEGNGNSVTFVDTYSSGLGGPIWLLEWRLTEDGDVSRGIASEDGTLADVSSGTPPLYVCMAMKDGVVKTYISADGEEFIRADTTNLACGSEECASDTLQTVANAPLDDRPDRFGLQFSNPLEGSTLSGEVSYIRFKSSGITGESSADCPQP